MREDFQLAVRAGVFFPYFRFANFSAVSERIGQTVLVDKILPGGRQRVLQYPEITVSFDLKADC